MMSLAEQKAFFEEEGYLIVEGVLSVDELAACHEEIERLHRLSAELESAGDPASSRFQREPYAKGANRPDGLPVLRKIEKTREISTFFRDLSVHPGLLRVVGGLLGPDLLLFRSTLMLKPAFHGSAHAPHQDSAYWPIEPPALVTVSIALNDATTENGCFKVIPRSHTWGLRDWGLIAQAQDAETAHERDLQDARQIEVPLKAGSALFFHSLMVHGSGPNRSSQPRNTALYAYFPPHVRYVPGKGGPREKTYPVACGLDGRKTFTLETAGQQVQAGPGASSPVVTKKNELNFRSKYNKLYSNYTSCLTMASRRPHRLTFPHAPIPETSLHRIGRAFMRNTEVQETNEVLNELRGELHEVVILLSTIARHIDDFRYETHKLNRYLRNNPREEQSSA